MNDHGIGDTRRLGGKTVFLSASVPRSERSNQFQTIQDAQIQIEEAVVSLTRAVLAEDGRLVFGGHPSISPLVGLVAAEYALSRSPEGDEHSAHVRHNDGERTELIQIFQSEAFRGYLPDESWQLFRRGFAGVQWIPAVANERFNPELRSEPQCTLSLTRMRREMLERTSPIAMICIGGMEGVEEEAKLFREVCSNSRIYAFETTGGAARNLVNKTKSVRSFDKELMDRLHDNFSLPTDVEGERIENLVQREDSKHDIRVVPYPLICQALVREIASEDEGFHIHVSASD
ncbi:MAG: hypothetical protein KF886_09820 [Candidatus Hydrogenedentes bacterium]|nr:hypothetical protein [Candidatus Hydrogenedentota bacterium]